MINNCKLTASLSPGLGNYVELKNCSFFFLLICVSSIATTNSSRFPTIFIIRIKFSETSNKNYRRKEKQPVCECVLEGGKAKPSRGVKTCEQKKNQYVWGLSVSLSACLYVCLSVSTSVSASSCASASASASLYLSLATAELYGAKEWRPVPVPCLPSSRLVCYRDSFAEPAKWPILFYLRTQLGGREGGGHNHCKPFE